MNKVPPLGIPRGAKGRLLAEGGFRRVQGGLVSSTLNGTDLNSVHQNGSGKLGFHF